MQLAVNRYLLAGTVIAFFTTTTAFFGAPRGIEEFTVPVWDILLQLNLCSAFVFITLGLLEANESPAPEQNLALKLFGAAFAGYQFVCITAAAGLEMPLGAQLFLFTTALTCVAAGWAYFGLSLLRQLDNPS